MKNTTVIGRNYEDSMEKMRRKDSNPAYFLDTLTKSQTTIAVKNGKAKYTGPRNCGTKSANPTHSAINRVMPMIQRIVNMIHARCHTSPRQSMN